MFLRDVAFLVRLAVHRHAAFMITVGVVPQ